MCILLHINSSDCAISCLSGFHYYPLDLITSVVKPLVALFLSSVTKKESHTILASLFKHVFFTKAVLVRGSNKAEKYNTVQQSSVI